MREHATALESDVGEGRFMNPQPTRAEPEVVIVEPDAEAGLLVVVTVYGVSQ
jgi:hypothetical protein